MPTDIIMPQMGESIVEGTITKWLKKPGDKVQRDEPLFEISTDKVDAEIPSPASGVLQEIKVSEGTTVGVNTAIVGTISARRAAAAVPARPAHATATPEKPAPEKKEAKQSAPASPSAPAASAPPAESGEEKKRAPRRWFAKSRASTGFVFRRFPAPASAAASPSRTYSPSLKETHPPQRQPHPARRPRPRPPLLPPGLRPRQPPLPTQAISFP